MYRPRTTDWTYAFPYTPEADVGFGPHFAHIASTTRSTPPMNKADALAQVADTTNLRQALDVAALLQEGLTAAEAGRHLGISRRTVFARLALLDVQADDSARKYLRLKALNLAEDWITASAQAAQAGNHKPAKDALLHAGLIEELQGDKRNAAHVLIQIGSPESPIQALAPQVIEAERVSPPEPDSSS